MMEQARNLQKSIIQAARHMGAQERDRHQRIAQLKYEVRLMFSLQNPNTRLDTSERILRNHTLCLSVNCTTRSITQIKYPTASSLVLKGHSLQNGFVFSQVMLRPAASISKDDVAGGLVFHWIDAENYWYDRFQPSRSASCSGIQILEAIRSRKRNHSEAMVQPWCGF
eukprot:Selendium_serpulae@DN824_c0_g1_i1.p1